MLNDNLVKTLIEKNIINNSTQVTARFKKIDQSCKGLEIDDLCVIEEVVETKAGKCYFKLSRVDSHEQITVPSENILMVDGMSPNLLARAFELNIDGSKKAQGKRRGRPRKYFPIGEQPEINK